MQFPYFNKQSFRGVGFFLEKLVPFPGDLPKGYRWAVEIRNKNWISEKFYSVLRQQGVALALIDHIWMPRPRDYFEVGDPITADFTYIRWLGDRKGIEAQTTRWDMAAATSAFDASKMTFGLSGQASSLARTVI